MRLAAALLAAAVIVRARPFYARLGRQQFLGVDNDMDLSGEARLEVDFTTGDINAQVAHNMNVTPGCGIDSQSCVTLRCEHPDADKQGNWGLFTNGGQDAGAQRIQGEYQDWDDAATYEDAFTQGYCAVEVVYGGVVIKGWLLPVLPTPEFFHAVDPKGVEIEIEAFQDVRRIDGKHAVRFAFSYFPSPTETVDTYDPSKSFLLHIDGLTPTLIGSYSGDGSGGGFATEGVFWIDAVGPFIADRFGGQRAWLVDGTTGNTVKEMPLGPSQYLAQDFKVYSLVQPVSIVGDVVQHTSTLRLDAVAGAAPDGVNPVTLTSLAYTADWEVEAGTELWCVQQVATGLEKIGEFVKDVTTPLEGNVVLDTPNVMTFVAWRTLRNGGCELRGNYGNPAVPYTAALLRWTDNADDRTYHVAEMNQDTHYDTGPPQISGLLRIRTFGPGALGALDGFLPAPVAGQNINVVDPFLEVWSLDGPIGVAGSGAWSWVAGVLRWGLFQRKAPQVHLRVAVPQMLSVDPAARFRGVAGRVEDYTDFTGFQAAMEGADGSRAYASVAWSRYADVAGAAAGDGLQWTITHNHGEITGAVLARRRDPFTFTNPYEVLVDLQTTPLAANAMGEVFNADVVVLPGGLNELQKLIAQGLVFIVLYSGAYSTGGGQLGARLVPNEPGRPFTAFLAKNSAENFGYARMTLHLPTFQLAFDVAHTQPCLLSSCEHMAFTAPWDGIDFGYVPSGDLSGGVTGGTMFVHKSATGPLPMEFVAALGREAAELAVMGQPTNGGLAGVMSPTSTEAWDYYARTDRGTFKARLHLDPLHLAYNVTVDAGYSLQLVRQQFLGFGTALYSQPLPPNPTVLETVELAGSGVIELTARELGALRAGWWWVQSFNTPSPPAPTQFPRSDPSMAPVLPDEPVEAFEAVLLPETDVADPTVAHHEVQVLTRLHPSSGFAESVLLAPKALACGNPCVAHPNTGLAPDAVSKLPQDPLTFGPFLQATGVTAPPGRDGAMDSHYQTQWDMHDGGPMNPQAMRPPLLPPVPSSVLLRAKVDGVELTANAGSTVGVLTGVLGGAWRTEEAAATVHIGCAGGAGRMESADGSAVHGSIAMRITPTADGKYTIMFDRMWSNVSATTMWKLGVGEIVRYEGADLAAGGEITGVPYRIVRALRSGLGFMSAMVAGEGTLRCPLTDLRHTPREVYIDPTPRQVAPLLDFATLAVMKLYPSGFACVSAIGVDRFMFSVTAGVPGAPPVGHAASDGVSHLRVALWDAAAILAGGAVAAVDGTDVPIVPTQSLRFLVRWSHPKGDADTVRALQESALEYQLFGGKLVLLNSWAGAPASGNLVLAQMKLYCADTGDAANLIVDGVEGLLAPPAGGGASTHAGALTCLRAGQGVVAYQKSSLDAISMGVVIPGDDGAVFALDGTADPLYDPGNAAADDTPVDGHKTLYNAVRAASGLDYHGGVRGWVHISGGVFVVLEFAVHVPVGAAPLDCNLTCPVGDATTPRLQSCVNVYTGGYADAASKCTPLLPVPSAVLGGEVLPDSGTATVVVGLNTLDAVGYTVAGVDGARVLELAFRLLRDEAHVTVHNKQTVLTRAPVHSASPRLMHLRPRLADEGPLPPLLKFTGRVVDGSACEVVMTMALDLSTRRLVPPSTHCPSGTPCNFWWYRRSLAGEAAVAHNLYGALIGSYAVGDTVPSWVVNGLLTGRVLVEPTAGVRGVRLTLDAAVESATADCTQGRAEDESSCLASIEYSPATQALSAAVVMAVNGGTAQASCDPAAAECLLHVTAAGDVDSTALHLQTLVAATQTADGCVAAASPPLSLRQWWAVTAAQRVLTVAVGDGVGGSVSAEFAFNVASGEGRAVKYQATLDHHEIGRARATARGVAWDELLTEQSLAQDPFRYPPKPPPFLELEVSRVAFIVSGTDGGEGRELWDHIPPCSVRLADGGCLQLRVGRRGEEGPLVDVLRTLMNEGYTDNEPDAAGFAPFSGRRNTALGIDDDALLKDSRWRGAKPRAGVLAHPALQALRNGWAHAVVQARRGANAAMANEHVYRGHMVPYTPPVAAYFAHGYEEHDGTGVDGDENAASPTKQVHVHVRVAAFGGFQIGVGYTWNVWETDDADAWQPVRLALPTLPGAADPIAEVALPKFPAGAEHEQIHGFLWLPLDGGLPAALRLRQALWRGEDGGAAALHFEGRAAFNGTRDGTGRGEAVLPLHPAPCGPAGCPGGYTARTRWYEQTTLTEAQPSPRLCSAVRSAVGTCEQRAYCSRGASGQCRVALNAVSAAFDNTSGVLKLKAEDAESLAASGGDGALGVWMSSAGTWGLEAGFRWDAGHPVAVLTAGNQSTAQDLPPLQLNAPGALWAVDRAGLSVGFGDSLRGVLVPAAPEANGSWTAKDVADDFAERQELFALRVVAVLRHGELTGWFYPGTGHLDGAGVLDYTLTYSADSDCGRCNCAAVNKVTLEIAGQPVAALDAQLAGQRAFYVDAREEWLISGTVQLPAHAALQLYRQVHSTAERSVAPDGKAAQIVVMADKECERSTVLPYAAPVDDDSFMIASKVWFWMLVLCLMGVCGFVLWHAGKKVREKRRFESPSPPAQLDDQLLPSDGSPSGGFPDVSEGDVRGLLDNPSDLKVGRESSKADSEGITNPLLVSGGDPRRAVPAVFGDDDPFPSLQQKAVSGAPLVLVHPPELGPQLDEDAGPVPTLTQVGVDNATVAARAEESLTAVSTTGDKEANELLLAPARPQGETPLGTELRAAEARQKLESHIGTKEAKLLERKLETARLEEQLRLVRKPTPVEDDGIDDMML